MASESKWQVLEHDQTRMPLAEAVADAAGRTVNLHATPWTGSPLVTRESIRAVQDRLFGERARLADQSLGGIALDSFHHPRGVLARAQALAAAAFGVRDTHFVTGGCTMANTIAVAATLPRAGRALVDARAHQSVHFAVDDRTASVTVIPEIDGGIDSAGAAQLLREARANGRPFDMVALAASTYDGRRLDCPPVLSQLAAADPRVRFVLDDAWCAVHCFSRASAHPGPLAALPLLRARGHGNAIVVTQSAHKTMLALRQGAFVHADSDGDTELDKRLRSSIFRHHTTSPSWPILASLDIARAHAVADGDLSVRRALALIRGLTGTLAQRTAGRFQVRVPDARTPYRPDVMRVCIRVPPGADAVAVRETLWRRSGIHIPRVRGDRLVASMTIGVGEDALDRLVEALATLEVTEGPGVSRARPSLEPEFDGFLVAYPPGVPLRLPYAGPGTVGAGELEDEMNNGAEIFEIPSRRYPDAALVARRDHRPAGDSRPS